MTKIVCATRGGEGSRAAQMAAITQAKAVDGRLIFLYVTDPTTLSGVDEALYSAVHEELNWMGKTLLKIAQQRAELSNLEAEVVIRSGNVRDEVCRYLSENEVDLLVLGAPRGTTANVFGDDAIEQFALEIQQQTGVTVEIIRPETLPERAGTSPGQRS